MYSYIYKLNNKFYSAVEKLQPMAIYVYIESIYCQLNLLNRGNIIIEKSRIIEKITRSRYKSSIIYLDKYLLLIHSQIYSK